MGRRHVMPRSMPGNVPQEHPGMAHYLISLKETDAPAESHRGSRGTAFDAEVARTASFVHKLKEELKKHGLSEQLARISPPSPLPIVNVTATPKVAEFIQALPEVDVVVRDQDDIHLIR